MTDKFPLKLVVYPAIVLALIIGFFWAFDIMAIKGNEVGVLETFGGGVQQEPLPPRTYLVMPWERVYSYPTSVQVFVMNDKNDEEVNVGRKSDSYLVQAKDNQDMHLSLQVQWRIDPAHVVSLHQQVGKEGIEERVLRPIMLRVVKDEATTRDALTAYSGVGLVELQQAIEKDLANPTGELASRGVVVDSFVIEHIRLDEKYVSEITARQVATQKELRAKQEEKAAVAEAAKAKAEAGAAYERRVVEAKTKKEEMVLAAEADNEKQVLAAQADKQKTVLAAEAKKESGELEAAAILAIGKATAEAERLKFSAYGAEGADLYARIEVARSMGNSFSGIKGYLPENMQVFTLGESFSKAVDNLMKSGQNK